jgi:hypothetical protein
MSQPRSAGSILKNARPLGWICWLIVVRFGAWRVLWQMENGFPLTMVKKCGMWFLGQNLGRLHRSKISLFSSLATCPVAAVPAFTPVSLRQVFGRQFVRCFGHFSQQILEFPQSGTGNDDAITDSAAFLNDAQKTSSWIFLEQEDKAFAFNLHLFGFQGVFLDVWTKWQVIARLHGRARSEW